MAEGKRKRIGVDRFGVVGYTSADINARIDPTEKQDAYSQLHELILNGHLPVRGDFVPEQKHVRYMKRFCRPEQVCPLTFAWGMTANVYTGDVVNPLV